NPGIAQIRAREREFLPLSAGEIGAILETLPQHLIEAVGQRINNLARTALAAQRIDIVFAEVNSLQQDFTSGRLIEPGNQFHQSAFALAVFSHHSDPFYSGNSQIDVLQNQVSGSGIAERNVAELEAVTNGAWRRQRVRGVADLGLHREQSEQIRKEQGLMRDIGEV